MFTPSRHLLALLRMSTPVSLGLLANMAMQLVDTAFVGRLNAVALGGVSLGNAFFSVFFGVSLGTLLGLDYLFARAWGAREPQSLHRSLKAGLWISAGVSGLCVLVILFCGSIFERFGVAPDLAREARRYLIPVSFSLIPFLVFQTFRQCLQSMHVVMPQLWIVIAANGVNALANAGLIFGKWGLPELGVQGAALATLFSRVFMVLLVLPVFARETKRLGVSVDWSDLFQLSEERRQSIREALRLGVPASAQVILEVGVFSAATLLAGRLGAIPLGAHHIVLQLASLTFMASLGISSGGATLVGNAVGANQRDDARALGWTALGMGAVLMSGCALMFWLFPRGLARAFTSDLEVVALCVPLFAVAAFFQIFDALQAIATGILRGIGNTLASAGANLVGHWAIGLPLGLYLCYPRQYGIVGLWVGLSTGLVIVALTLVWVWHRLSRRA